MTYDKTYFRMVGIALLPALGVSVVVVLVGQLLNVSKPIVDRISQVLFFPIFWGMCYYLKSRGRAMPGKRSRFDT